MKARISSGNTLVALPISDHKALALSSLAEIRSYGLLRPSFIDRRPVKSNTDEKLDRAHKLHEQTQRSFDKARTDRAIEYGMYIEGVEVEDSEGNLARGGVPPITLYSPSQLEEGENGLILPYNGVLTAIDGETQTEARFMLAEKLPETEQLPIALVVYHGISFEHARQIVHDTNHYVTPVSEAHSASFNSNGALTKALLAALSASGISESKMNAKGQVANAKTLFARVQLMAFLSGCVLGQEVARRGVSAAVLSKLNSPMGSPVGQSCIESASEAIVMSAQSGEIGKYNKSLWQIAGVLSAKGISPRELNWSAANKAYLTTITKGRGGPRMPISQKLEKIETAFITKAFM